MKTYIKNTYYGLVDSFRLVQGNARVIVLTQPFWTITNNMYAPFLSLYMKALGCSYEQIGLINAAGMIVGSVIALFAGWVTDRLGRRRTCIVADMMCWAVACLLWGLARNFAWFMAASLANAFVRLIAVSWNCTLQEGTPPENRLNVYWWTNIMGTIAVFATPLMSTLLINPLGLIPAMRWVLLGSSALLATAFVVRNRRLKELPIGLERMEASKGVSALAALRAYIPLLRLLKKNPLLLIFISVRALYYVQLGIKGTYLPLTVVDGLGFMDSTIGMISLITGVVMLLSQFLLLPKLKTLPPSKTLFASMAALIVSTVMLMVSPVSNTPILVLSTVISAIGALVAGLMVDTAAANKLPDNDRAPLLAFMTILMVALSAPFMWLGGLLAELPGIGPRLPMALVALLFVACMVLLAVASRIEKNKELGNISQVEQAASGSV
jgi:MFS transporter, DHA1 family, tetracycline resistance protein